MSAHLTPEQETFALDYDPWGERDAAYRVLSNAFVVTRKAAECAICFSAIPAGSRVRASREVEDGQAATFRFCPTCCWLMAHRNDEPSEADIAAGTDNFERLMNRYSLVGLRETQETRP